MKPGILLQLVSFFGLLSILSVGGSNSVVPEMSRKAVQTEHWLSADQFTDLFALSQAAPGPSNLIVALLGYQVAGFWGALAAQLAMIVPAAIVMVLVSKVWVSTAGSRWHLALEQGLTPIAIGLIIASGWTIAEGSGLDIPGYALVAACTVLFWKTRINPIPVLALAGVIGWLGLV
ncbi:chromate transporter [Microvirga pudoricolor]|uniref:chromate transporter n=1 Tax=Microvirga pudoricolor TaxID=2778729 RepID=UPI0019521601|nr:chromate transporter [Microvirga pudoricolor]MBM6596408.1 chromate transporter [Microvirga pudoricolor]